MAAYPAYPVNPAYPVRVDASLDAPLSRWLWLVKWVLVIPHYLVLAFLWLAFVVLSAVAMAAIVFTGRYPRTIFKFIAAVMLLVSGRYPEQIFDFVLGMNRWVLQVAAYAGLMTDQYQPFRIDMGGCDPGALTRPGARPAV